VDLVLNGREEIRAWFTERQALERRVSRHVATNVMVTLVGDDRAEVLSYLINYRHDRPEGETGLPVPADTPKFVGECSDVLRLESDGWRFASRTVTVPFVRTSRRVG
jgi:hypothetical protein